MAAHMTYRAADGDGSSSSSSLLPCHNLDLQSPTPYTDAIKSRKVVDHVKRPLNPFMVWSQIERRKLVHFNQDLHNAEISKLLGKRWKLLTPEERKPFVEESDRLRLLHVREFPEYKYKPKPKKNSRRATPTKPAILSKPTAPKKKPPCLSFPPAPELPMFALKAPEPSPSKFRRIAPEPPPSKFTLAPGPPPSRFTLAPGPPPSKFTLQKEVAPELHPSKFTLDKRIAPELLPSKFTLNKRMAPERPHSKSRIAPELPFSKFTLNKRIAPGRLPMLKIAPELPSSKFTLDKRNTPDPPSSKFTLNKKVYLGPKSQNNTTQDLTEVRNQNFKLSFQIDEAFQGNVNTSKAAVGVNKRKSSSAPTYAECPPVLQPYKIPEVIIHPKNSRELPCELLVNRDSTFSGEDTRILWSNEYSLHIPEESSLGPTSGRTCSSGKKWSRMFNELTKKSSKKYTSVREEIQDIAKTYFALKKMESDLLAQCSVPLKPCPTMTELVGENWTLEDFGCDVLRRK